MAKRLNSDEKLILCSISKYLEELGLSQSFNQLLGEAQIEKEKFNRTSFPCLREAYDSFFPKKSEQILLNCWIVQYLNLCRLPNSSSMLLSEAAYIKDDMNTPGTQAAFNEFLEFLIVELKKKTKKTLSKKRKRSVLQEQTEKTKQEKRKKTKKTVSKKSVLKEQTDEGNEDEGVQVENKEMAVEFKKITELLKRAQERLLSMAGTRPNIMPNSKLADLLSSWNCTDALYTWRTKRPRLICKSYRQRFEDCWAVAISRGQNYAVALSNFGKPMLTPEKVRDGVSRNFQDDERGLKHLGHAHSFLVDRYIDEMKVYRRPEKGYEDFESLIERLLIKCPVVVSFDILPSYQFYKGKGVFIPRALECQLRDYENFPGHAVLVTGCGVQIKNGVITEFWEYQNSMGREWGERGFGRLARRKGLIRQVIEMKVTKNNL